MRRRTIERRMKLCLYKLRPEFPQFIDIIFDHMKGVPDHLTLPGQHFNKRWAEAVGMAFDAMDNRLISVFLDDLRDTPEGWVRTYTPQETIELLKNGNVEHISLDHDLGDDEAIGTGYDVLLWLEEQVATRRATPPVIWLHTDNASARQKMKAAKDQIYKLWLNNLKGRSYESTTD